MHLISFMHIEYMCIMYEDFLLDAIHPKSFGDSMRGLLIFLAATPQRGISVAFVGPRHCDGHALPVLFAITTGMTEVVSPLEPLI